MIPKDLDLDGLNQNDCQAEYEQLTEEQKSLTVEMTDLSKTNNRVVAALVGFLPMLTLTVPHVQAQNVDGVDTSGVEAIDEIIVTTTRAPSARSTRRSGSS